MSSNPSQPRSKRAAGRRPPRPTTARQSVAGPIVSLALHAGLIVLTLLTWHRMVDMSEETHAVPVDLITIAEKTNVAAQAPPQPPDKVVIPPQELTAPALPQFANVEPAPVPPIPQFKVKPDKTQDADQDQPRTKKQIQQDLDAVLNKVLAPQKVPKNAKPGTRVIEGIGNQNMMTADLSDALKSMIARCWSPPTGAPNASDLVVDFDLVLNPDGSVGRLQVLPDTVVAATGNPYTRAAVEAASRAIYQCQPYRLPAARYDQWHEVNPFRFDPRQMMGQ